MTLTILYEDKDLLAIQKPAGMLVYPVSGARKEITISDLVQKKISYPDEIKSSRSGIVHRLDRDTSGVLLISKNPETEMELKNMFKQRKIKKNYLALVWGKTEHKTAEIRIPLTRGHKDRLRVIPGFRGRESITVYHLENYYPQSNMSLLNVNLKTGRTHQIRVHLNAIGHPVVGDKKYSKRKSNLGRQFLHASQVSFRHPVTGKNITVQAPLPPELSGYLSDLK